MAHKAKIFISCGQREKRSRKDIDEVGFTNELKKVLEARGFNVYVARVASVLEDIDGVITKELESSDYYIFIDFPREKVGRGKYRGSLFTHQELALAHYLGFKENVLLLKHPKVLLEGFLQYILGNPTSNPEIFSSPEKMGEVVGGMVTEKNWSPSFSRHLVPTTITGPVDIHFGPPNAMRRYLAWGIQIRNRTIRNAALEVIAMLRQVSPVNPPGDSSCPDRSWLKWQGLSTYKMMVCPGDDATFDAFAFSFDQKGFVLFSKADVSSISSIISTPGEYLLDYRLESPNFPRRDFSVRVNVTTDQKNTTANLVDD
jgi:hypothetical protein